jgi:hypothetical protein
MNNLKTSSVVKLCVFLTDHHAMKACWVTRWRWAASFTPRPLYPQGKSLWYQLDRRLGPRVGLEAVVKRRIPSPCRDSNPRSSTHTHTHTHTHIYMMKQIPWTSWTRGRDRRKFKTHVQDSHVTAHCWNKCPRSHFTKRLCENRNTILRLCSSHRLVFFLRSSDEAIFSHDPYITMNACIISQAVQFSMSCTFLHYC